MKRNVLMAILATAMFMAGCSGSSGGEAVGSGAASEQVALRLIVELGSDSAAADALIIAMDRGYSGAQILDASDNDQLRTDGTIEGEQPAGEALGIVLYSLDGQGEGALGGEVILASFYQVPETPIEKLRKNATWDRGVGTTATKAIVQLLALGFTPQDIIEMLILGIDAGADYPDEPDGPVLCYRVVDELYCPGGERFLVAAAEPPTQEPPDSVEEPATDEQPPVGPVTFSGSATQGAIENGSSDDLRSVVFAATIDASTVVLSATLTVHEWHRGGFEEVFVDQNCGATYRHVLRFEGPAGNPTELRAVVEASEVVETHGALCDGDDDQRGLLTVGDSRGRFQGQANGLGIEGTLDFISQPLEISAS